MSTIAAARAIQKVRTTALKGLSNDLRRFGPLPKETSPAVPPTSSHNATVLPNPFLPRKVAKGKTRPPVYSLRKQAEMVKTAKAAGLLHLLPPGPKTPPALAIPTASGKAQEKIQVTESASQEELLVTKNLKTELQLLGDKKEDLVWLEPISWAGKVKEKAKGAELGITLYAGKKRMFKGHKWERLLEGRKKKQMILMRDMKKRIYNYKNYYKRRKPDPLKPPRTLKAPKLPF